MQAVCEEAAAHKDECPHPPTISKRPAKLRYLRTSGSSASPAASNMFPAHRPDARPYPCLEILSCSLSNLIPEVFRYSGLRAPDTPLRLAVWRLVV
jgi:hypothetical protein